MICHGSQAGPAWFKMLLGLGGNQGGGGGEGFCLKTNTFSKTSFTAKVPILEVLSYKKTLCPKQVLPRRCLSKIFCHKKRHFSQNQFCREGVNLRGFFITNMYVFQKQVCREGANLRGFVQNLSNKKVFFPTQVLYIYIYIAY